MRTNNLKNLVFERDSYTCVLCTRPASDTHHVKHRSQGGRDQPHNLVSVCRLHHEILHGSRIKGFISSEEAQQTVIEYISDYYAEEIQAGIIRIF